MKILFLNITIAVNNETFDVRIDSEQRIGKALEILHETGRCRTNACPDYYRSHMNKTLVSAYKTFGDESVFDGDLLEAI